MGMGMGFGNNSDEDAPLSEINMTPLVDVMLVLVVIFLVTAPMLTQAIKLDLPNEVAKEVIDEKPVTISLTDKGIFYLQNKTVSEEELELYLKEVSQTTPEKSIHLRADVKVEYGKVSRILALAQKYNLNNIGFVTQAE